MNYEGVTPDIAEGLLVLKERIKAAKIPPSKLDETINLATWNVRELGKKPRLDTRLVANIDFAPTFYDVAGITNPGYQVDGKSLFDPGNDRDWMLTESVRWKALQDKQGSLIETKTDDPDKPFVEFYDWNIDPGEMDGEPRLNTSHQKKRFREMSAVLDRVKDCAGSECP